MFRPAALHRDFTERDELLEDLPAARQASAEDPLLRRRSSAQQSNDLTSQHITDFLRLLRRSDSIYIDHGDGTIEPLVCPQFAQKDDMQINNQAEDRKTADEVFAKTFLPLLNAYKITRNTKANLLKSLTTSSVSIMPSDSDEDPQDNLMAYGYEPKVYQQGFVIRLERNGVSTETFGFVRPAIGSKFELKRQKGSGQQTEYYTNILMRIRTENITKSSSLKNRMEFKHFGVANRKKSTRSRKYTTRAELPHAWETDLDGTFPKKPWGCLGLPWF